MSEKNSKPKVIGVDNEGFEIIQSAVLAVLNDFPGLNGRRISRGCLDDSGGISLEPESGALVLTERKDIIGNVQQQCQFPFFVVFRVGQISEASISGACELLDKLGAWVCREPVRVGGELLMLNSYPALIDGREIVSATRSNAYGLEPNNNHTQDWVIPIIVTYTHAFTRV